MSHVEPERKSDVGALPDLGPPAYVRWRASELGKITEALQETLILRLAGNVAGKRVLDIGCGDGKLAAELARRGAVVSAIDGSGEMVAAARQRAEAEHVAIDVQVGAAQAIPFPDGHFDMVVAMTVLCFVGDALPVFGEVARVLAPGGRLVIGELNRWSVWAAERRLRAWLGSALWRRGRFRTAQELRSLAVAAGLEAGTVTGAIYYPRSAKVARLMLGLEPWLGRNTTFGAAFLAFTATKPAAGLEAFQRPP